MFYYAASKILQSPRRFSLCRATIPRDWQLRIRTLLLFTFNVQIRQGVEQYCCYISFVQQKSFWSHGLREELLSIDENDFSSTTWTA